MGAAESILLEVQIIAFSRNERTHPNLVLQVQEIEIFCGLQIGRPSRFLQGLWASFSCPSVHLSLFFEVFFELVFNSDCIRQKGECSPNADWSESFWSAKTNYIIAKHVYTRRFVRDRSFLEVFILDRA